MGAFSTPGLNKMNKYRRHLLFAVSIALVSFSANAESLNQSPSGCLTKKTTTDCVVGMPFVLLTQTPLDACNHITLTKGYLQ